MDGEIALGMTTRLDQLCKLVQAPMHLPSGMSPTFSNELLTLISAVMILIFEDVEKNKIKIHTANKYPFMQKKLYSHIG